MEADTVDVPVEASTPDNTTLNYTATNLPAGLLIDPNNGEITGTVTIGDATGGLGEQGLYLVCITATDGTYSASATILWTISSPVAITAIGVQQNSEGDSVNLPVAASSSAGPTLSYSASNLPAGLSIDPATGIISGIIANGAATGGDEGQGDYLVTVTVSDGTYSQNSTFAWMGSTSTISPT